MGMAYIIRQGQFERWYIFHPEDVRLAWTGSQWTAVWPDGFPVGGVQVCNFGTEQEAADYAALHLEGR